MLHKRVRSKAVTLPALVIAVGALTPVAQASATILAYQYIEAHCESANTAECPQQPEVHYTVPEGEAVAASFTANADLCSAIDVRLTKDDPETGWSQASDWLRVGPGQTVGSPIAIGAGDHVLRVEAKGIDGGCNNGHPGVWGGTVRIDSQPAAAPDSPSTAPGG